MTDLLAYKLSTLPSTFQAPTPLMSDDPMDKTFTPHTAFGFYDVEKFKLLQHSCEHVKVYANSVSECSFDDPFIGIECTLDPKTGVLTYDKEAHAELLALIVQYKAHHNITSWIKLEYRNVIDCDDWQLDDRPDLMYSLKKVKGAKVAKSASLPLPVAVPVEEKYWTIDNDNDCFTATVSPSTIIVEITDCECECEDECGCKVLDVPYEKVFIGDNDLKCERWEPKGKFPGNTILVKESSGRYTFIGWEIFSFTPLDGDVIETYYSPIGSDRNTYPYAVGQKYVYFMRYKEAVPIEKIRLEDDASEQYCCPCCDTPTVPFETTMIQESLY